MRIVFFGASQLGYDACKLILDNKLAEVAGIFTIPQEFPISYSDKPVKNVQFADFTGLAEQFNIPIHYVTGKMSMFKEQIQELKPDFLLVIGWYYMVPKSIRELAPLGCAGIHASLLPKYRGGAPLVWAVINGEKEAGISFFYFEDGVDDGDIIAQVSFPILPEDSIADLLKKTNSATLEVVKKYIPMLADGTAPRIIQDASQATYVPQRKPEDGEIDLTKPAEEIYNFIRAQSSPYPGAFIKTADGKKLIIEKVRIE